MCGIIAYNGNKQAAPLLVEGLKRLEYRGYDSAGIGVVSGGGLSVIKRKGEVSKLEKKVSETNIGGSLGIAHTRWATHGEPNHGNAHPHLDCSGRIAIVHNGIIENYQSLKKMLLKKGHKFRSKTDSEVLAHLIEDFLYRGKSRPSGKDGTFQLEQAVRSVLKCVEGTFGLAVIFADSNKIIAARRGSPLVVGIGDGEMFVASDVSALMGHTKRVVYLDENELAVVAKDGYQVSDLDGNCVGKEVKEIQWSLEQIEKEGYKFFMEKEIFEQPEAVRNNLRGRLKGDQIKLSVDIDFDGLEKIVIAACGTSWHAALIGRYLIEELARIPVEVDYASEFRYREPIISRDSLLIAISQSGETADTLAALREAKDRGSQTLGIVNVVGSTIAREVDSGIYLHAGPEIGVASTKAFTTELSSLILLALYLRNNYMDTPPQEKPPGLGPQKPRRLGNAAASIRKSPGFKRLCKELSSIPFKMETVLKYTKPIMEVAERFEDAHDFLYLARGINFPIALEGALKLKELSYAHAEGYPAGEMKHGPIALIEEGTPVIFIATTSKTLGKTISNMEEVRARGGELIAVVDEDSKEKVGNLSQHKFTVPRTSEILSPLLTVLPLQLLSYYIADLRGLNVDKPRNLAKSVTVE